MNLFLNLVAAVVGLALGVTLYRWVLRLIQDRRR